MPSVREELLQFNPTTIDDVRKEYDLNKPGAMEQAIDILHEWIQKQEHFVKKDFRREYLERIIISTKGSVERAKIRVDKICTLRTTVPELFTKCNTKEIVSPSLHQAFVNVCMPKLTEDNYRPQIIQLKRNAYPAILLDAYRHSMIEGFGFRIKNIFIISSSKVVDMLTNLVKRLFGAKLRQRVIVLKTVEDLHDHISKEVLPEDFGGKQKTIMELYDKWTEELSSKEHVLAYVKEMTQACTNEALRQSDQPNAEHLGIAGSFKVLNVD